MRITEKELLKRLTELTQDNDHVAAYHQIAEYYQLEDSAKIFQGINMICDGAGYLPQKVSDYQYDVYSTMMEYIRTNHAATYWAIHDCL